MKRRPASAMISYLGLATAAIIVMGAATYAWAEPTTILRVEQVLERSAEHLPTILKAQAEIDRQRGALLSARGAFDRTLDSDTDVRALGYYDGRSTDITLNQPIPDYSARLYGSYRVSDGEYPSYEGKLDTQTGGEFAVGAIFSLLRDRDIDSRRVKVAQETLKLSQAEFALTLEKMNAQMIALLHYWDWLARGLEYRVREDIWQLATSRQDALEREVRAGNRAQMFLIENRQNILKRKSSVRDAYRKLQNSAQKLSFYYRDDLGNPLQPRQSMLPEDFDTRWMSSYQPELLQSEYEIAQMAEYILYQRPDIQILQAEMERLDQSRRLAENQILPRLDMQTEVSQDMGADERIREETESRIKLQLSIPLQTRDARGQIRAAEAGMRMVEYERDMLMQEITIALQTIVNDLAIGQELMQITAEEMEVAEALLSAERKRFSDGASDFFLLNLREETLAQARVGHIQATQRYMDALSRYVAVTMQQPALGL